MYYNNTVVVNKYIFCIIYNELCDEAKGCVLRVTTRMYGNFRRVCPLSGGSC